MSFFQQVSVDPMWSDQSGPRGLPGTQGIPGQSIVGPQGPEGEDAQGITLKGHWNRIAQYKIGDVVAIDGSSFVATGPNTHKRPSVRSDFWQLLASKGATGERGPVGFAQRGRPGRDGLNATGAGGEGFPELESVTGENIAVGEIVYLNGNLLMRAQADDINTSHAVGICTVAALSGFTASYLTEGVLTLTDWTNAVGATTLVKGALYFLSVDKAGQMTTAAPTTATQTVIILGRATAPDTLDLTINQPIVL